MKLYDVRLTILIMGRTCSSCKQHYECTVAAEGEQDAVDKAKAKSKADPETNKFLVNYVRTKK